MTNVSFFGNREKIKRHNLGSMPDLKQIHFIGHRFTFASIGTFARDFPHEEQLIFPLNGIVVVGFAVGAVTNTHGLLYEFIHRLKVTDIAAVFGFDRVAIKGELLFTDSAPDQHYCLD